MSAPVTEIDLRDQPGWIPVDDFPWRLGLVLVQLKWNAAQLDRECDLGKNNTQRWMDGARPRDYENVCFKIARRTGCDLRWLMYGGQLTARSRWTALGGLRVIPGGQISHRPLGQMALPLFAQIADN